MDKENVYIYTKGILLVIKEIMALQQLMELRLLF